MAEIREIGTEITQQVVAAPAIPVAPELKPLLVGVCRRVVKQLLGGTYANLAVTQPLVDLPLGGAADPTTVKVYVVNEFGTFEIPKDTVESITEFALTTDNGSIKLAADLQVERTSQASSTTGTVVKTGSGVGAVFTLNDPNAKFLSNLTRPLGSLKAYVKIGATKYEITTWNTETSVVIVPASEGAGDALVASSPNTYIVLTEELAVGRLPGATVDVLHSYAALRSDIVGKILEVTGPSQAAAVFGAPDALNPLGLAMFLLTSISSTTTCAGAAILADDTTDHADALDIATQDRYYYILPISNKSDVNSLYISHVVSQSLPQNKHERVTFVNIPVPAEKIKVATHTNGGVTLSVKTITAPGETFLTKGVTPGDLFKYVVSGETYSLFVAHVPSQTQIEFLSLTPLEAGGPVYAGATTFSVTSQPYTNDQKVSALSQYALGILDRRVRVIAPDSITIDLDGVETDLDGGYLGAIIVGMYSIVEPGTPISTVQVPLVKKIRGLDGLNQNQRKTLTSNGIFLLTQAFTAPAPIVRHEVTTDTRNKKVQQASFTHAVDSIAFGLRDVVNAYLGRSNITDEFLRLILTAVDSIFKFFRDRKGRITKYQIEDLRRSDIPGLEDSVLIKASLDVPPAANNADVTFIL